MNISQLFPHKDGQEIDQLLGRIEELLQTNRKALADDIAERLRQDHPAESNDSPLRDIPRIHLSPREKAVLALIVQGKTNKEIGSDIYLSEGGVKNIVTKLNRKLDYEVRVQLAVFAVLHGLVAGEALSMYHKQN